MVYCDYLDLWCVFNYEFTGDLILSFIIIEALIIYFCAKGQVPFKTTLILCLIGAFIFVGITFNLTIWVFSVLLLGGISYYLLQKRIRQG